MRRNLQEIAARINPEALQEANDVLRSTGTTIEDILDEAQADKAKQITEEYRRHEPAAIELVDRRLAEANLKTDDLVAKELSAELPLLERIDRLITIAETRRNNTIREIERRRRALAEALWRSVQEVERDEVKLIETTPAGGKDEA